MTVAELRNCSVICIYYHQESECPSVSPVQKETQLSSLENETKKNICVYMTSETHFLDRDLNFHIISKRKKTDYVEIRIHKTEFSEGTSEKGSGAVEEKNWRQH